MFTGVTRFPAVKPLTVRDLADETLLGAIFLAEEVDNTAALNGRFGKNFRRNLKNAAAITRDRVQKLPLVVAMDVSAKFHEATGMYVHRLLERVAAI